MRGSREAPPERPGPGVRSTFAVTLVHCPGGDDSHGIRQHCSWNEHAAFMDSQVTSGLILMAGPLGVVSGPSTSSRQATSPRSAGLSPTIPIIRREQF